MKKLFILLILSMLWIWSVHAQSRTDALLVAATAKHSAAVESASSRTTNNLYSIQGAQGLILLQLKAINKLQDLVYKGLTEVNGIIKNGLAAKDIVQLGKDIFENMSKVSSIAKGNPALVIFAKNSASDFTQRAVTLGAEVSTMVLRGGGKNMMDAGERSRLLHHIKRELTLLRGLSYGIHRSMYWAKRRGIWNSLNPYSGWINRDKRIANDIFRNVKRLKR